MKKAFNIISSVITGLLIILLVSLVISKLFFGIEINAVITGSMEPDLPVGSMIITKPISYEDIEIGDDITFSREGSSTLVTHRVVQKLDKTKEVTTRGIANNTTDPPIDYKDIRGKVIFSIPFIGYAVMFISTFFGKIVCIMAVGIAVLLSFLGVRKNQNPSKFES